MAHRGGEDGSHLARPATQGGGLGAHRSQKQAPDAVQDLHEAFHDMRQPVASVLALAAALTEPDPPVAVCGRLEQADSNRPNGWALFMPASQRTGPERPGRPAR